MNTNENNVGDIDIDERPAKRLKLDASVDDVSTHLEPSNVLHVSGLDPSTSEADLLDILSNFGEISYATVKPHKRTALVEFEEIHSAIWCVTYAQTNYIFILGQQASFKYSTTKMIQRMGLESEKPHKVLIFTIYNAFHPVTEDVIYTICKTYGDIIQIKLIQQNLLHALVEFDTVESAKEAKHGLNGADIYRRCCTLKVEFAKVFSFELLQTTDNFRSNLPSFSPDQFSNIQPMIYQQNYFQSSMDVGEYRGEFDSSPGGSCVVVIYGIDQERFNCDKLFNLLCLYGNVVRIKFMRLKLHAALVQMGDALQVQSAIEKLDNSYVFGNRLSLRPSKKLTLHAIRDPFDLPDGMPSYKDYTGSRNQRFDSPLAWRNRVIRPTRVLRYYNVPANMDEEQFKKIFAENECPSPVNILISPHRSERSSTGIIVFDTVEEAMEVLIKCNHLPVESPFGKIPYIIKFAFAFRREFRK